MTFLKMEYFAGFVFWFAAQFFIYRWLISRNKQAIEADKLQENDKDVKSDVLTNVSQSVNIISLDMPSGTRLYPRMFPTNMPFESGVIVDYFVKSIFYNWKSRDSASKWCDRINEEFSRMEQRSKMLNYIYASNLDLGAVSPTIQNARILPTDPSRRDLEILCKLYYSGSISMELHTQLQLYSVVDAHLKVSVCEFEADMMIRLTDNGDDILLSFTCSQNPSIEFDITSAVGNFTDLGPIKQILSSTLKALLNKLVVDPNGRHYTLSPFTGIRLVKPDLNQQRKLAAERQKKRKLVAPVLGRLYVTVREAEVWLNKDSNELNSAPYCMVSFNRQIRKTKIIYKTFQPKWEETLTFDVFDTLDSINISLHDKERLIKKDDFLGHCTLPFGNLIPNETIRLTDVLRKGKSNDDAGIIHFEVNYESFADNKNTNLIKTVVYKKDTEALFVDGALVECVQEETGITSEANLITADNEDVLAAAAQTAEDRPIPTSSPASTDNSPVHVSSSPSQQQQPHKSSSFVRRVAENLSSAKSATADTAEFMLQVDIMQARGLMPANSSGFSDSYCVVSVGRQTKKTKVIKATLSPIWNEQLKFLLNQRPTEVLIDVFDYNKFTQPTFLGQVRIQLLPSAELPFTKTSTFTLSNSKPQSMRSSSSSSMAQLATPVSGEIDIGVELSRREILPEAQFDGNTQNQLNTATSISAGELLSNTDLTDENAPALPSREQSIDHSESSTSQHRYRQKAASAVKQISSAGLSASKIVASNLSNKFQQWKSSKQQN